MLMDFCKDVLAHTHNLGLFQTVKVFNEEGNTKVETMDEGRNVMVYGSYTGTIGEFSTDIGFSRLGVLSGFANFQSFNEDKATVDIKMKQFQGEEIPEEIAFNSGAGHKASYRLMNSAALSEFNVPRFKGVNWDVSFIPTKKAIADLRQFASILGTFEDKFTISTDDGVLNFSIGKGSSDKSVLPFATDVIGELKNNMEYNLKDLLSILKLAETESSSMFISDRGAIMVEMTNGFSTYQYVCRAQSR